MRITIIPALQAVLDLIPKTQLVFLATAQGKPFTAAGFGNWFRDMCDEAGLKGLSAHGLRKALQAMGADVGLSDRELMAIAGHETTRMTSLYTKQRDRDLLADRGLARISASIFMEGFGAPSRGVPESAPILDENGNEINGPALPWLPEQDSNLRPFD
jgi:Phage integrase family